MREVTDQNLINELNGLSIGSGSSMADVNDPNIISQLNALRDKGQQMDRPQRSPLDRIGTRILPNLAIGMEQGGRAVRNAPYNLTNMISPEIAQKLSSGPVGSRLFAPVSGQSSLADLFNMNNPDISDDLVRGVGKYGPVAAALGTGSIPGMMLKGGLSGAVLEKDPMAGGIIGAATAGAGGAVGKAIGKLPSIYRNIKSGFRPVKTLEELTKKYNEKSIDPLIKEGANKYEASIGKFKNDLMPNIKNIKSGAEDLKDFLGPKVKRYITRLEKKPTLGNADILKRQINNDMASLSGKQAAGDTAVSDRLYATGAIKRLLKTDTLKALRKLDPKGSKNHLNAARNYIEADKYWAKNVHPEKTLSSILKNMSHKTDANSISGANRAAEAILKESTKSPFNIPKEATESAKKMGQQLRNVKGLKYSGIGAALIGGGEAARKLTHLLGA